MDRVKQDARGEDRRPPHRASARRASAASSASVGSVGSSEPGDPPRTGQYRPSKAPALRVDEDRYRPGGRRTSAEPLSASWKPHVEAPAEKPAEAAPQSGIAKLTKTYGWRVYALPILVVLTVLVVVNTANSPAQPIAEQGTSAPGAESAGGDTPGSGAIDGNGEQAIPENPATPVDLKVPTADLPEGIPFTQAGAGKWHVVPGTGPKVGTGKLYTYTVEVEDGIDPASYAGDDAFATAVQGTLSNPAQGWTWDGKIAFQRVDGNFPNPSFKVSLTTPETTHRPDACGFQIKFEASCYRKSLGRVLINLARWVRGAKAYGADMTGYRQYAINHEVGHALGNQHVGCPGTDQPAPVMMQQSFGVNDDYVAMLNDIPGGDKGKVAKDGRICKTNSWPNPTP
ncbi:DUF3152 domain-containing protein [Amycolatopsis sp. A133]|uniref:DUF3152 domain-containing protein n=1 Tax=Amycolatopsis sp. A133 TaxID=3064472 RepID=UPI0027EF8332|nr:DUF3152 domain-containing protein [Amycolatopsis sp. A133]MDQ7809260.1 DUF3152 domain-containing protein [Amycolatopsis sp. A133]